jgi:hypothetical protein
MVLKVLKTTLARSNVQWGKAFTIWTEPRFEGFFSTVIAVGKFRDEVMIALRTRRLRSVVDSGTVDTGVIAIEGPTEEMCSTLEDTRELSQFYEILYESFRLRGREIVGLLQSVFEVSRSLGFLLKSRVQRSHDLQFVTALLQEGIVEAIARSSSPVCRD